MKRKKRYMLLLVLAGGLLLGGCSGGKDIQSKAKETEENSLEIGMSFDSFVIERWMRDRDVFVSTAQSLGAAVNVQNANGNVEEQISQIEYFIQKKMDVIVIIAIDGERLQEVAVRAKEAGIKIICYDRLIMNADADLYISFDNEKVGTLMGEALSAALPEGGDIFAIYGSQSDHNVTQVNEGLTKALEGSGLNIVYSAYCENWLAELAFDAVNEGLSGHRDIVGVMCGNDDLASQAIKALSEQRLAGKVAVVAQDADLSACQHIVEGTQTMTVYKPVEELAKKAARLAVELGQGQDITGEGAQLRVKNTINDGENDIPYFSIEPVAVTADNMDSVIIDSGFHLKEDVYLNVK
ncbi:MAG: substrate-binding domain-containing protein [Lachnospiraceae bacterium]|nr:substrate-binding domain-containing protein [Lachnospiraceae bacterium]